MSGVNTEKFITASKKEGGYGNVINLLHTDRKLKRSGKLLELTDLGFGSREENATYDKTLDKERTLLGRELNNLRKKYNVKDKNKIIKVPKILHTFS